MDNAIFISLLNPSLAFILAVTFAALWQHQKNRPYLAVLAFAYATCSVGFLLQYFVLPIGFEASRILSNVFFALSAFALSAAIIKRSGRPVPTLALAALLLAGLAGVTWFMLVQPNLTGRMFAMNFAIGSIAMLVAVELRALPVRGPIERVLMVLALLAGANCILRPLAIVWLHGPYMSYEGFYNSLYWTTAVLTHAVLSLIIALTLVSAAALDVVRELQSDSLTDPLSALLNRRGFEARGAELLARCAPANLPVALVLADLDHFKALNDVYGHAAGDRVIADFAGRLKQAAGIRGVAGRLGGEEFAVLLPLTDLASARLLAEAVRMVFSSGAVDGLPEGVKTTASFGVAARSGDEALAALLARADDALYQAKKGGRDSVRLSYQRPMEPPPTAVAAGAA